MQFPSVGLESLDCLPQFVHLGLAKRRQVLLELLNVVSGGGLNQGLELSALNQLLHDQVVVDRGGGRRGSLERSVSGGPALPCQDIGHGQEGMSHGVKEEQERSERQGDRGRDPSQHAAHGINLAAVLPVHQEGQAQEETQAQDHGREDEVTGLEGLEGAHGPEVASGLEERSHDDPGQREGHAGQRGDWEILGVDDTVSPVVVLLLQEGRVLAHHGHAGAGHVGTGPKDGRAPG